MPGDDPSPALEGVAPRLAVLGSPISHSRSPVIHHAAYRRLELPWRYDAVELEAPSLEGFLAERGPEWRGFSLTMPLKEEARRLAAVLDPVATESRVVNTMLRLAGGRWAGFNTDVGGLAAAIEEAGLDAASTVVIGSGATAVSAILAARRLGALQVEVVARNLSAIDDLVARFDGTVEAGGSAPLRVRGAPLPHLAEASRPAGGCEPTLVLSTLPGPAGRELELPVSSAGRSLTSVPLFDVAYDPWPSPLALRWRDAGSVAHAGVGMLLHQALLQVRIFVGGDPSSVLPDERELFAAMRVAAGVGE
ncbi:shikimate dehydrogenase [Leucobacter weissii]|uniref:Shikimate dehydrogenase n=1 Tax=Leucobacter weissii TaxID=1983706 RepID=A0A939MKW7_9MICO|nr:shikimate dehydrogenase [Leucobacter weissii]MBO1902868.1 shikimate dehydrogenase [Leucobacter weissii]